MLRAHTASGWDGSHMITIGRYWSCKGNKEKKSTGYSDKGISYWR